MKKRQRRKIKSSCIVLIFLIIFVIYICFKSNLNNMQNLKKTYLNNVINNSNTEINSQWQDVIVSYLDLYTDSLVNLKSQDITNLFDDLNSREAYLTQSTIDLQIYHHSKQLNDMKLKKAYYDIEFESVEINNDKIIINFLENDYYNFNYLDDITSRLIDIKNTFVLKNKDGKYIIDSIRVTRDNYVIFTSLLNEDFTISDIDKLNKIYKEKIDKEISKNTELSQTANNKKYNQIKKCDNSYNRQKAVDYSYNYVDKRNNKYSDYSSLGGNCANYASQSLFESGIPMDYFGNYQWKYFGDEVNEENIQRGRSTSWTSTYYFYEYAKNNTGYGLCAEVDVNLYYAQIGDIIHVGYEKENFSHTTIVSKIIKDKSNVIDILVNSNTTGLKDYPIFGYIYNNKRLIKILGYNDK